MADDEVKIKLTAEDRFSKALERQIKKMERFRKQSKEIEKKTRAINKRLQELNTVKAVSKIARMRQEIRKVNEMVKKKREIEVVARAQKVTREMELIERRYQALRQMLNNKILSMKLQVKETVLNKIEKVERIFDQVRQKAKKAIKIALSLNDRASPTINRVLKKLTILKRPIRAIADLKDKASSKLIKLQARAKWVTSKLKPLANIPAGIKDKASKILEKIKAKTAFLKKPMEMLIKAKDKTSKVMGGIKTKLGGLMKLAAKGITVAVGVVGAGALSALKDGMKLEQQQVSIEHFIGYSNQGASKADISKMTDAYMSDLRTNANLTPFTTNEVVSAGSRAVGVSGGDTGQAMKYLKLAQDMAAMNPEASLSDAIEAIADAKNGEMERLKSFNFLADKEQFDKAGGDIFAMESVNGDKLSEMFAGGAEKLSQTAAGKWSTLVGNLGEIKTDVGSQLLEKVKPGLDKAVKWLGSNKDRITEQLSSGVANGLNKIAEFGAEVWPKIEPLVTTLKDAFEQLKPTFKSIGETAGKLFDALLEHGVPMLQEFIDFAAPIFEKLWNLVLKPFIDWVISQMPVLKEAFKAVLDFLSRFLSPRIEALIGLAGILGPIFKLAWELIKGAIQIAWNIIEPILTWVWEKQQMLIDKVKEMKDKYGPALEDIGEFFTGLWNKVEEVAGWIGGKIDSIIEKAKEAADFVKSLFESDGTALSVEQQGMYELGASGSSYNGRPYASGIRNVPRDNYPALLHKGEAVVPARDNRGGKGKGGSITVAKLADTIVVREEADIDKIATKLVKKIEEADLNMA